MRVLFAFLTLASQVFAQSQPPREHVLGWRFAVQDDAAGPAVLGITGVEVTSRQLPVGATQQAVDKIRADLQARQLSAVVYRANTANPAAVATASKLGVQVLVVPPGGDLSALAKAASQANIRLALDATAGALLDVEKALAAVQPLNKQVALWVSPSAWEKAGTKPLAAIYMLRDHLAGASLAGQSNDEFVREAYRLDIKPLIFTVPASDVKRAANTVEQLVAYHQNFASRTQGVRRLAGVSPEERQKIEAALPASAPAKPKKARKLLVFDLNVGRFGHPSIPHANLAMQLMGQKTGAFEATVTSDPAMLQPAKWKEFDAVYLNNTIGDIFSTTEAREAFAEFVRNGGGVMGNHATTVTMTEWKEFGDILGARGASHRMTDEKAVINVEDPGNPIVKAFGAGPFEYADEHFRFQPPYSRDTVHVLLSMDPLKTDLNQGRCFGQCYRDDNDYPIAWVRQYGKGRVFYTTLGHNPHVFWQPNMLQMFLAAAQYILGDLAVDATPRPRQSMLDKVLPEVANYDWGQDEAPVRQLDRAMGMLKAEKDVEQKLLAVLKSTTKVGAKDAIARQLAIVGTSASVPVLAPMLSDKTTVDIARYALERIEGPEASNALRTALGATQDARVKSGLIHSLARRKDTASVPMLQAIMASSDATLSAAAVNALGMIGTPDAEKALFAAPLTAKTGEALLVLADQHPGPRAVSIYTKLAVPRNPEEVRIAAIHGLARNNAGDALASALRDEAANVQTAALLNLPAPAVIAAMNTLSPALQIQAVAALRGNTSARPAFLALTGSQVPQVRAAALESLATVATSEDLPLLVKLAASADDQLAARLALTRAPGIDAGIAARIPMAEGKEKLELIRAAGERGSRTASAAILASVKDADPAVRREALRALRGIAQPEQSSALLEMLAKASEDDRPEIERALAAALGRADKLNAQPVVAAFDNATDPDTKASLVTVMALTGDQSALPLLRKALEQSDLVVQRAAIAGLTDWSSPDPMDDLLKVARTSADPAIKSLAIRGYVKLVQRPVGRMPGETAKLLGAAMSLSSRPEEKKAVLAAVQRVVSTESLQIAQSAANDPAVAAEAKLAASTIERALAARGRQ
jgi:type 1 glutamine amidotransferase/HEAT repeat protein